MCRSRRLVILTFNKRFQGRLEMDAQRSQDRTGCTVGAAEPDGSSLPGWIYHDAGRSRD
jgi:hypothetical protein